MGVHSFYDLVQHHGHNVVVVTYGGRGEDALNVAIECEDCCEVLLDFDKYSEDEEDYT